MEASYVYKIVRILLVGTAKGVDNIMQLQIHQIVLVEYIQIGAKYVAL